jgi:phosphoserine phosphatase
MADEDCPWPTPSSRRSLLATAAGALSVAALGPSDAAAVVTAHPVDQPSTRKVATVADDPLPSWNDGPNKQAIFDFVAAVTEEGGDQFVPDNERIATFDNDGTLWTEQPLYAQAYFALDQIKAQEPQHPEWQTEQPFAAILTGDMEAMKQFSEEDIGKIVAVAHAGMTADEFDAHALAWVHSGKNPLTGHLFIESVYQPQLELLDYLRGYGFLTFIVSGGGIDLMRTFSSEVYGVPSHQVIGSSAEVTFSPEDGIATLTKQPVLNSLDDKEGKPVNIRLHIGQKPILAFGNSDGDLPMLQYTDTGDGPRLMLIVHHDDA